MATYGVTPSIRVRDMARSIEFYGGKLGFEVQRGGPTGENVSLKRGAASVMLETPASFYSPGYNAAIRERIGTPSANALYIEADDLPELYARATDEGLEIVDPLADREWGQSEFTVADPDGHWLTFWKARP